MTQRIHSLVFDSVMPSQATAIGLQGRISALCRDTLPEILERALAAYDPPDRTLRLQRVEIDLGVIPTSTLETAILESLRNTLSRTLARLLGDSNRSAGEVEQITPRASLLEQLECFLRHGWLAWNADKASIRNPDAVLRSLLEQDRPATIDLLIRLAPIQAARQRLVLNVTQDTLCHLLAAWLGISRDSIEELLAASEWLRARLDRAGIGVHPKLFLFEPFFLPPPPTMRSSDSSALLRHWLQVALGRDLFPSTVNWNAFMDQLGISPSKPGQSAPPGQRPTQGTLPAAGRELHLPGGSDGFPPSLTGLSRALTDHLRELEARFGSPTEQSNATIVEEPAGSQRPAPPEAEPWWVQNAGLVLLWPYLERYFERLGLMEEGRFIDPGHQFQALNELEYLARGDADYREYDLVLNKVLCGLPLTAPVDPEFITAPSDPARAEELLTSVIGHWTIIGHTSIKGLRTSFLRRDGRLSEQEASWTLLIDRKGFDVLLDHLPFPIRAVRLPWMEKPLYVEW